MDPDKKAAIINWLNSSPSTPDIPVEDQEVIKVHRMLLTYHNDEGIPRMEDTEFVSARSLLSKATNVSHKLTSVKNSIVRLSTILQGFNIPIQDTLAEIEDLKQALNVAAGADNVKTDKQNF